MLRYDSAGFSPHAVFMDNIVACPPSGDLTPTSRTPIYQDGGAMPHINTVRNRLSADPYIQVCPRDERPPLPQAGW
jgi:hypothetical protein